MATLKDQRICPYCGNALVLGDLPIVATEFRKGAAGTEHGGIDLGELNEDTANEPWSGVRTLYRVGGFPVIAESPAKRWAAANNGMLSRFRTPTLLDVGREGSSEDLPARICTHCYQPLPRDIDDRRLITIAVVGMHGASKTHFLATALYEGYHDRGLDHALACHEFEPDEATDKLLFTGYYDKLLDDHAVLPKTEVIGMNQVRFNPLVIRAQFAQGPPLAILFHDVAGEVFSDRALRNRYASFLQRADAIIFIIDPLRLRPIREFAQREYGDRLVKPGTVQMPQDGLLRAVADDLRERDLGGLPVSIAVSKSDLLVEYFQEPFLFANDPPSGRQAWLSNISDVDREVRGLLTDRLDALGLVAASRVFGNVVFHAIAPIGVQPVLKGEAVAPAAGDVSGVTSAFAQPTAPEFLQTQGHSLQDRAMIAEMRSRRCLDPFLSVFARLSLVAD